MPSPPMGWQIAPGHDDSQRGQGLLLLMLLSSSLLLLV